MFTVVAAPDRFPHKCLSCGAGTGRDWYLDFGEDVDTPGHVMNTVYICNLCMVAAAKDRGYVDQEPLLHRIKELEDSLFDAQTKAEGLEQGLDGLLRARFVDPDTLASSDLEAWVGVDQPATGATREGDDGPQGGSSSTEGELGDAAREGTESGNGSGLADVLEHFSLDGGAKL